MVTQPNLNYVKAIDGGQLIALWESRQALSKSAWALAFLSAVLPGIEHHHLAKIKLGDRDSLLMTALQKYFALQISMSGRCPECQEEIEVSFLPEELGYPSMPTMGLSAYAEQDIAGHEMSIRPLCSDDLENHHTHEILDRVCKFKGTPPESEDILLALAEQITEAMAKLDPLADICFDLSCTVCGAIWEELFDPVEVVATQVDIRAPRLLEDVAVLARYYGWSENDILNMSFPRREYYLQTISA